MQRDILNLTCRAKGYSFQIWKKPRTIRGYKQTNEMYNECSVRQEDIYIQACTLFGACPSVTIAEAKLDEVEYLLRMAQQIRTDAGYGGEMTDRGASALEDLIEAYVYGGGREMTAKLCHHMETYLVDTAKDSHDPEYEKYLELKQKYGGK